MVVSVLLKFFYLPPPSVVITAMSAIGLLSLSNAGWMETKGKSMQYSKLLRVSDTNKNKPRVAGKVGIAVYTPAFFAGVFSLLAFPLGDLRFTLLRSAITTHFFKRLFEPSMALVKEGQGEQVRLEERVKQVVVVEVVELDVFGYWVDIEVEGYMIVEKGSKVDDVVVLVVDMIGFEKGSKKTVG